MSVFYHCKHYRSFVFWPILIVFLAVLCGYNNIVEGQVSKVEAVDLACYKISRGDFESAQEIVRQSINVQSEDLRQLETIIDEYMVIQARRDAFQDVAYQEQIGELGKLREKGFPKDINNIGKVFTVAFKVLEYSNKEQGQALLNDPFVKQTVRQAKRLADAYE